MYTFFLAVLFSTIPVSHSHWVFPIVSVNNGTPSKMWQYVRQLGPAEPAYMREPGNPNRPNPHWGHEMYTDAMRCGRASFEAASKTEVLAINAGDEITAFVYGGNGGLDDSFIPFDMYHPGAAQIYLSKAENGDLKSYRGDGDWFKIKNYGTTDGRTWDIHNKGSLNVTIPKSTPPGKYLLRTEYIAYHQEPEAQRYEFYLACTQLDISGPGGGMPGPLVKFPGAYDMFDRSLWRSFSMGRWSDRPGDNYKNPGPDVWTG